MTLGASSFCVAGATLGAPLSRQFRFAWLVQHLEHLHRGLRKSDDTWLLWAPAPFAWQEQHLEHLKLVLRGRCSTWSISITSGSFSAAGAALGTPSQRSAKARRHLIVVSSCGSDANAQGTVLIIQYHVEMEWDRTKSQGTVQSDKASPIMLDNVQECTSMAKQASDLIKSRKLSTPENTKKQNQNQPNRRTCSPPPGQSCAYAKRQRNNTHTDTERGKAQNKQSQESSCEMTDYIRPANHDSKVDFNCTQITGETGPTIKPETSNACDLSIRSCSLRVRSCVDLQNVVRINPPPPEGWRTGM